MNLSEQFEQAVTAAAAKGLAPWSIEAEAGEVSVQAELTAVERLACAMSKFEVRNRRWADASWDQVRTISERLAQKLTYLREPVRPIEADGEARIVQLRSNPPRQADDATSYYELQIQGGGAISLCRFEKTAGEPRRAIPMEITREVLRQLVDDVAAASQ